ncbi:MAG: hypothetical protein EXR27_21745 [Betaproteobacteria bacterium]|nr:hypothetical protein [Betaproteobacteria bacterium]
MDYAKPIPVPSEESQPFWDAARRGELMLQQCSGCGASRFPPSVICPECSSLAFEWKATSGRGKVWSYVVFHRAYHPAFKGDVPYAVVCVELEEGPRLLTGIEGIAPEALRCDMPVEVVFEEIGGGMRLPKFRPRAAAA